MAIVYLVDRGDPENADFFAGRSNGFRVWMERSSVEWAERTAREFSEVDLYLVERYKDGWVLRSLRSAAPFKGHARRIARQDARMPEAIRNVLSPMSPYRPIVHGQSKNPPLSTNPRVRLQCDQEKDCKEPVSMIDNKGWTYCTKHGEQRKSAGVPCRKMKPAEIKKLEEGGTIKYA